MTTQKKIDPATLTRLPDPPPKEADEVTRFLHFYDRGSNEHLAVHLGQRNTTVITGDCRVLASMDVDFTRAKRPDVLIAFAVSPEAYRARGHYVITEQGKPPDFVMEIASESTGREDTGPKRDAYAALGIPEYWRFDNTGTHHKTKLAGDRLAAERYEPIEINVLPDGRHQGYSSVLNLILEWNNGDLKWLDPSTGESIASIEQEREARLAAQAEAEEEREGLRRDQARIRELEEELARMRQKPDTGP